MESPSPRPKGLWNPWCCTGAAAGRWLKSADYRELPGAAGCEFLRFHRAIEFASSALIDPISKTFVAVLGSSAKQEQVPIVQFR